MVIINSNETDQTTNDIIDWLIFYGVNFKRINVSDNLVVKNLIINHEVNFELIFIDTGEVIKSKEITFYWYRRGDLNIYLKPDPKLGDCFANEQDKLKQFVHHYLVNRVPSIGNFYDNDINKLIVLEEAAKLGISIPDTLITIDKECLLDFYNKHSKIVTKAINNIANASLTRLVQIEDIEDSDPSFFYTLFQCYTEKFVELRIFFLKGTFWASAIFSQSDEKTKVDFRNYNYDKPNRITPFKLPVEIERRLKELNDKLELSSGSIDMILTCEDTYVLLEINPIGQFRNFSYF